MDDGRKTRRNEGKERRRRWSGWEEGEEGKRKEEGGKEGGRMEGRVDFLLDSLSFQASPGVISLKGKGSSSMWLLAEGCSQNPDLNGMCRTTLGGLGAWQVGSAPYAHFQLPCAMGLL